MILKVSIVIPCFRNASQLRRSLGLILKSRGMGKEFGAEIILVDDSPDKTVRDVANDFRKSGADMRYIHPWGNAGIAKARNIGARLAKNEIIIATDTDVDVQKDTILNTIKAFEKHTTAGMVSGTVRWKDGHVDRPREHDRKLKIGKTTYIEMLHGRYVAYYKSLFMKVGGYDDKLFPMQGEGPDLSMKFWRMGFPLVFEPSIKVNHVRHGKGKSPYMYHGWNNKRTMLMFRSILLYMYKYGCFSGKSNWAKTLSKEMGKNFGDDSELTALSSSAESISWINRNIAAINASKRVAPKFYDFKPYDVFSDKKLFRKCLTSSGKIITPARKKVF